MAFKNIAIVLIYVNKMGCVVWRRGLQVPARCSSEDGQVGVTHSEQHIKLSCRLKMLANIKTVLKVLLGCFTATLVWKSLQDCVTGSPARPRFVMLHIAVLMVKNAVSWEETVLSRQTPESTFQFHQPAVKRPNTWEEGSGRDALFKDSQLYFYPHAHDHTSVRKNHIQFLIV